MKGQIEQYEWKVSWAFKNWKDCKEIQMNGLLSFWKLNDMCITN